MAKQITIPQIQEEINKLNTNRNESINKIKEYEERNITETNNFIMNIINEDIEKEEKIINKLNLNIQKLEYQILVGGRKLKTNRAISKELVNAGFSKSHYIAPVGGGDGCTVGDFKAIDSPTQIIVSYNGEGNKLLNYLIEKYGNDITVNEYELLIRK